MTMKPKIAVPAGAHEREDKPQKQEAQSGLVQSGDVFFRGTVTRITYRSNDSGFGVLRAEAEAGSESQSMNTGTLTTVVGNVPPSLSPGASFIARGDWQTHRRFGRQFRAWSITEVEPTGSEAISRYLSSGAVRGFGPTLAERVVARFGDETLQVIDETPERLLEVPGIGEKKLEEILASWQQKKNIREVLLFFQNIGVSLKLAQRIYNAYGDRSIEKVSAAPYALAREIWGIGFQTADRIASGLGIDGLAPERIAAGVAFVLEQASDDGHCYLTEELLTERAKELLRIDDEEAIKKGIQNAALRGDIIQDGEALYVPFLYTAENQLAQAIAARVGPYARPAKPLPHSLIEATCEQAVLSDIRGGSPVVVRLSEQQRKAIHLAAENDLLVITGGPGCGKTTVLRTLAKLFRSGGLEVRLAAPTGRAAQRMSEVCEMPASTIHRLLKYDPVTRAFVHNENEQLELDAIIIDESSMIDVPLASALFRAVPPGARIVIVGDADQLPSVGPGLFLGDLLELDSVPRIRLTTLFRRADESAITSIAHKINAGEVPHIPEPNGLIKTDAYFLPAPDAQSAAALIERLVTEQLPKKFGLSGSDITVLTPMNQGPLGVIALNKQLQEKQVPLMPGMTHVKVGELDFRVGDRVCQRVNNYNLHTNGVFNGDQGTIIGVDLEEKALYVELWDGREIRYPSETLHQLDLAYALTIHRSQGSEVPAVVMALHDSHHIMLERQLIYTGVTRARKLLIIVGTRRALKTAVNRIRSKRRNTRLTERTEALVATTPLQ